MSQREVRLVEKLVHGYGIGRLEGSQPDPVGRDGILDRLVQRTPHRQRVVVEHEAMSPDETGGRSRPAGAP